MSAGRGTLATRSNVQTAKPSEMVWENRTAKRYVDDVVFRAMRRTITPGSLRRVLTNPAASCSWEVAFTRTFAAHPVTFVGVERDPEVHALMCQRMQELNDPRRKHYFRSTEKPIEARDYLRSCDTTEPFDMIYMDWMGTWSAEKFDQIQTILDRGVLSSGGLLRFTIALNRGREARWANRMAGYDSPSFPILDLRDTGRALPHWKLYGVPGLVTAMAEEHGRKATVISAAVYHSWASPVEPGTPEASFTLRIK